MRRGWKMIYEINGICKNFIHTLFIKYVNYYFKYYDINITIK
jgi:hypothetical protein